MQFEWWRKREEKREPAIRLVRDSSSGEGGGGVRSLHFCFGMVLSGADGGLFREFRPAYSEEYARIASIFPIGEKCRNWNGIRNSRIFFFFCLVFYRLHVQVIFLLDTVYIASIDRPSLAISLLLLRFPFCGLLLNLPLHSIFVISLLFPFFFFF